MPSTMRILGWRATGLRCPDHEINFVQSRDQTYKVSLIQMPNGTGKTTTLELLRATLSGAACNRHEWNSNKIKDFKKKGSELRNGSFVLHLLLNGKRATIEMLFDFIEGRVIYKTTWGSGQEDGFKPPHEFHRFMQEEFVNFYIFDGELAQNLSSSNSTKANQVIEELFKINKLSNLRDEVSKYWDEATKNVTAKGIKGHNQRRNRVLYLDQHWKKLLIDRQCLENEINNQEIELNKLQNIYNIQILENSDRSERLEQLQNLIHKKNNEINGQIDLIFDLITRPTAMSESFLLDLHEFKNALDRVKLPESAAREFFQELANEKICVCGRNIDDNIRKIILDNADNYLGSDEVFLLNSMKTDIGDIVDVPEENSEKQLNEGLATLQVLVSERREMNDELSLLQFEVEQSNPEISLARNNINNINQSLEKLQSQIAQYDSDNDSAGDNSMSIKIIKKRLDEAENDLAESTKTLELKEKRDVLVEILNKAHKISKKQIIEEIRLQANNRISDLMPNNLIRIDDINNYLIFKEQRGVSMGEQLSVAYAFLSTLFHRADHELPFVVDSPAGSIDLEIRPNIGKIIPNLSDQFIAFTISSERAGFTSNIKQICGESIQFITLFRKTAEKFITKAREVEDIFETDDGMIVHDEKFFNEFQLDNEENGED